MAKKSKVSAFARAAAKSEPREANGDEFDYGKFQVRFVGCNESDNGSFCFTFAGAGKDKKIGERIQWFSTTGKSVHVSGPRIKRLAMLLAGFEDSDEYREFDPEGVFLDAILASDLDAAAEYLAEHGEGHKNAKAARAALDSAEFMIRVIKGGERDDGGNFHNAEFAALSDGADDSDTDEEDEDAPESEAKPRASKKASKRKAVEVEDEEDDADTDEDEEDEDAEPESEPAPRAKKKSSKRK